MNEFLAEDWRVIFGHNGLRSFDDFWCREIDWFEKPNFRRGGWSGVGRWELTAPDGREVTVFVKRQENHVTRTWRHPIRGMATLRREFENLLLFQQCGVPTPALLYFAERDAEGKLRAMLITEELGGFRSLDAWTTEWPRLGQPSLTVRRNFIDALARAIARMHAQHIQHNCLYAKHVFVRHSTGGDVDVRILDLEKAKRRLSRRAAVLRDLDTLNRHSTGWSRTDRVRFLRAYSDAAGYETVRPLWRTLAGLAAKKAD